MTGPRVTCKVSSDVPGELAGGRQGGIWGPLIREHHGAGLGRTREFNFVVTVSRRVSGGDALGADPAGIEFIPRPAPGSVFALGPPPAFWISRCLSVSPPGGSAGLSLLGSPAGERRGGQQGLGLPLVLM